MRSKELISLELRTEWTLDNLLLEMEQFSMTDKGFRAALK